METSTFAWRTEEERTAITWTDKEIFTHLEPQHRAKYLAGDRKDERCCRNRVYVDLSKTYGAKPGLCGRSDLEDFKKCLEDFVGVWSVFWHGKSKRNGSEDDPYEDNFRGVVTFKIIEFSIRPVDDPDRPGFMPGMDIPKLRFSPGDIKDCLAEVLRCYPFAQDFSLSNLGGRGYAMDPRYKEKGNATLPQIPFEWRIAQLPQDRIDMYVLRWRHANCDRPGRHYDKLITVYTDWYNEQPLETRALLEIRPPVFKPGATLRLYKKRKSRRSSTSPELATSHKRQSQDFDSSRMGQQFTAPLSGTGSSEAPRRPWIAYGLGADSRPAQPTVSGQPSTQLSPPAQPSTSMMFRGTEFTGPRIQEVPSNMNMNSRPVALPRPVPASSALSGSGPASGSGVTREMSSLSITALDSSYGRPVPPYQQPYQRHQQPGPYRYQAPPQRTYRNNITQAEFDRSRGLGQLPDPIQYKPQQEAAAVHKSNQAGKPYPSQIPQPNAKVYGRGQGLVQHSAAFLTKGARDYRPGQAMRLLEQGPRQAQNRGQQNRPPPTEGLPGVDAMLKWAPPPMMMTPPGKAVPAISASQTATSTCDHGAPQHGITAAVPPGGANPQPSYQSTRDVWTGRSVSPSQRPAFSRERNHFGPQAAQELDRRPPHGCSVPVVPDNPRGENEGASQSGYRGHFGRGGEGRGGGPPSRS